MGTGQGRRRRLAPPASHVGFAPVADASGSPLWAMCGRLRVGKGFLHVGRRGRSSHVFGLLTRFTRPLAIMPSADQVPVTTSHSTMLWPKWVVLIAGSTGTALRAVRPFQPSHRAGCPDAIFVTPRVRQVLCSARPWPSSPTPSARSCWRARWQRPWSAAAPTRPQARDDAWCLGVWRNGSRRSRPR